MDVYCKWICVFCVFFVGKFLTTTWVLFVGEGIDPLEINRKLCLSLFGYLFWVKTGSHLFFEHTCLGSASTIVQLQSIPFSDFFRQDWEWMAGLTKSGNEWIWFPMFGPNTCVWSSHASKIQTGALRFLYPTLTGREDLEVGGCSYLFPYLFRIFPCGSASELEIFQSYRFGQPGIFQFSLQQAPRVYLPTLLP